jgi:hypothetical protein
MEEMIENTIVDHLALLFDEVTKYTNMNKEGVLLLMHASFESNPHGIAAWKNIFEANLREILTPDCFPQ